MSSGVPRNIKDAAGTQGEAASLLPASLGTPAPRSRSPLLPSPGVGLQVDLLSAVIFVPQGLLAQLSF